ncbi:hypothetical protein [Lacrimispora aerotolerans]|uniref:hypothetical protein n=1 Tax=Lacrimispora aerotolerans TaxID=36832 RepID=UPI00047B7188|nr:hypothetical protein [Lacrimispora aerotolerans]
MIGNENENEIYFQRGNRDGQHGDHRNPCNNVGFPQNGKPSPPIVPQTPTYDDLLRYRHYWTYFWTIYGDYWLYVDRIDRNGFVWGCFVTYNSYCYVCIPFDWITNYVI